MLRSRGSWKRPACLWEGFRNPKRENNPFSLTNAIFPKKIRNLGIKKLRQTPKVILLHLETVPHPEIEPISLFKILKLRWSAVSAGKRGFDQSTEHFHFPRKAASRDKTQRDLKWVNLIVFAGIYTFSSLLESNIILLEFKLVSRTQFRGLWILSSRTQYLRSLKLAQPLKIWKSRIWGLHNCYWIQGGGRETFCIQCFFSNKILKDGLTSVYFSWTENNRTV